ncbi:MAG: hypothetical protein M1818_006989 [Claussenomyces sp. TS43310]|nr:MAG: hypothetical protein M1818_006989 [Claussenomyces sp. TS43310]
MAFLLHLALLLLLSVTRAQNTTTAYNTTTQDVAGCTCGFYDQEADMVFTESSIVYFNETDGIPDDLVLESFAHKYDRGWNAIYRQGAAVENVQITNHSTTHDLPGLSLYCDPSDNDGLVVGASMRTARQDIFFGSFRTSIKAPRQWVHGSALSMLLEHNKTERWNIDVMNTDNSSWAWVTMLAKGQFSDLWLGRNFTDLIAAGMYPWNYTEYRVDWTRDRIDYYIGGVLQQNFTKEMNGTLPSTPAPLKWQHWSLGNIYDTQGPPGQRSEANIGWTRIFFNSSLTTDEQRQAFDQRCTPAAACRMDDNSLRNSSAYPPEALNPWQQEQEKYTVPWVPLIIDIIFLSLIAVITTKTLWRRSSWPDLVQMLGFSKKGRVASSGSTSVLTPDSGSEMKGLSVRAQDIDPSEIDTTVRSGDGDSSNMPRDASCTSFSPPPTYSGFLTPLPQYQTPAVSRGPSRVSSMDDLAIEPVPRNESVGSFLYMAGSGPSGSRPTLQHPMRVAPGQSIGGTQPYRSTSNPFLPRMEEGPSTPAPEGIPPAPTTPGALSPVPSSAVDGILSIAQSEPGPSAQVTDAKEKQPEVKVNEVAAGHKGGIPPQQRVDYLAGFVGMSAILVTMNHFGLTFWAAVIIPSVRPHYSSEKWARKTIATYFLDPLWIGPFLMISTRFLVSNYLRTGKLDNMAQKIVARPFRLLTPVASIATLVYFFMDSGALNWLEYLASVTWSPWPFTTIVPNPGIFISEIIQLAYLIPNAAPMITYNYCTGVLWTIPVQLQGAWQTLLALLMIKECKTPWKRFALYAFCITNHWYGLSWGSYYYAGVLLADLDITFKYKKWLYAKPFVYYPFLWLLIAVTLGGFTIDLISQYTGVEYAMYEYGWHPDTESALTISQSGNSVYPDYFIPRLNAFLATVSMQTIVEISPIVQKVLSAKMLQWLFPHIFTIYLIHGFIFWSIGSWAMISIFSYGCPYWLCVLLTVIICYGTLFASLPLLTPPIELLGKNFTLRLWEHASEEPVPRQPTTYPFGTELLMRNVDPAALSSREGSPSCDGSVEEKGKAFGDEKAKGAAFERIVEV